jgi:aspartate aminotransferase
VIGKHSPDGEKIGSHRDFAAYLLQSADLAVFPGEDCGVSPAVRVSFANPPDAIEAAGRRLQRACAALN